MLAYGLTIFWGAFLLFQIQPLMGKYLLPLFGGGPAVWTTCLLFFQAVLVLGYAYAHLLTRWFRPRLQAFIHASVLCLALVSVPGVPVQPAKTWSQDSPSAGILQFLARNIGVAYLVLASTGPLLQNWSQRRCRLTSTYRLYALSNVGSLLGLLTYPLFFEAHFTRKMQTQFWAWGMVFYGAGCGLCALHVWAQPRRFSRLEDPAITRPEPLASPLLSQALKRVRVPILQRLQWILWPACASALLLALTNKLCLDVAAVPLLWVLPLAAYLLSFVICFDNPRWYWRTPFTFGLVFSLGAICWALFSGAGWLFWVQAGVYIVGLFICCVVCHGELYRSRPEHAALTDFYLSVSAGGALGGVFVSVIAPAVFTNYYELHWGLLTCALLLASKRTLEALGRLRDSAAAEYDRFANGSRPEGLARGLREDSAWASRDWHRLGAASLWVCCFLLAGTLWFQARRPGASIVHKSRNFFGVLTVFEHRKDEPNGHHFLLQHGRITHGLQFVDPELQTWPTTYYGPESGVGLAFKALQTGPRRVGVLGLGTGTLAAYGRPGDYLHFYEINPQVGTLAASQFTYLNRCRAECEVTLGDARLVMEKEAAQDFDLLALDAFSSDSIPVHLLTQEAFELYLKHLKPSGVIAVHVSNHFLDLEPVVLDLARHFDLQSAIIDHEASQEQWWIYSSTWVLLSREARVLNDPAVRSAAKGQPVKRRPVRLWTDDFSSLYQILK